MGAGRRRTGYREAVYTSVSTAILGLEGGEV